MATPRIVMNVFDIFSPVRLVVKINGREDVGIYFAGTTISFVFDVRLRFLVPRLILPVTNVLVTIQEPDGSVLYCQEQAMSESSYIFTFTAQTTIASTHGPYTATVYVRRLPDETYNTEVRFVTDPFIAFVLE
jgi:hypothetical protein